ncbi:VOC family protein [Streptomyces sp. NPDC058228]|uniref:VOC family protein n=1 Tax=Streptomyces sp. NPDC058228 TaxID=3346390 RepID=UPI0036F0152A
MAVHGLLHAGLTVSDLDRSVEWYVNVIGLKAVHRQDGDNNYTRTLVGVPDAAIRVAQLAFPGSSSIWPSSHAIELIEYTRARGKHTAPSPNDVGASHVAFVVDDIDAVCARARRSGARLRNEPVTVTAGCNRNSRACYLHDPDGHTLELMEYGPERIAELKGEPT